MISRSRHVMWMWYHFTTTRESAHYSRTAKTVADRLENAETVKPKPVDIDGRTTASLTKSTREILDEKRLIRNRFGCELRSQPTMR